ncbi:hypothetical protein TM1040_1673 [Ruegeria sp. TM1040]|nr:hypothetical protein TM1040_1673 [Ruegeria sp. TM1040]
MEIAGHPARLVLFVQLSSALSGILPVGDVHFCAVLALRTASSSFAIRIGRGSSCQPSGSLTAKRARASRYLRSMSVLQFKFPPPCIQQDNAMTPLHLAVDALAHAGL